MKEFIHILKQTSLFSKLELKDIFSILKPIQTKTIEYKKDSMIAQEEDLCDSIGIILEGSVEVRKIYASGKTITLAQLHTSDLFGEAIVFSNKNQYPATIISLEDSQILFIQKKDMIALCRQHTLILESFMQLLSNRILMLNKKVQQLSLGSLREKIINYLASLREQQKSLILKLPLSRKNLAEYLGVQRPSLSREISNMQKEGLIGIEKGKIIVKDKAIFEMI